MRRRQFVFSAATVALVTGCAVLPNLSKSAAPGVARVGILAGSATSAVSMPEIAGLKQGLADLGYLDGQNIAIELRDADYVLERLPELASELVQLPVDVLVAVPSPSVVAARQATTLIPIVFLNVSDPVGKGWAASLAHPGGNVTGVSGPPDAQYGKVVEYLAQIIPGLSRIAFLASLSPTDPSIGPSAVQLTTGAANSLGIALKFLDVRTSEDVEPALAEALASRTDAMMAFGGVAISNALSRLVEFQLDNRIPFVTASMEWVQHGCLLGYGGSLSGQGRQAARFVDKILKGARPADLPVQEPDSYDLSVNQSTAQALGISIPPAVSQQVTQWV